MYYYEVIDNLLKIQFVSVQLIIELIISKMGYVIKKIKQETQQTNDKHRTYMTTACCRVYIFFYNIIIPHPKQAQKKQEKSNYY